MKSIMNKFSKDFSNHGKKTNWVFNSETSPKHSSSTQGRDHRQDFLTIWKTSFFRQILKSSANMYESSGSDSESLVQCRLAMIFLSNLLE